MSESLMIDTPTPTTEAAPSTKAKRPTRRRRALKRTGVALTAILALTLVSATANAIVTSAEKSQFAPYGERVTVDGGDVNVYRVAGDGPTLVFLSGLGTSAPAVDFAPLLRELDGFNILVVEGFGYGYADTNVGDRTVENITSELHQALRAEGVDTPVVLIGHSIAGLYMHYYADEYPGEVAGIVGIDPTPSKVMAVPTGTMPLGGIAAAARFTGFERWAAAISPSLSEPDSTAYTQDERARIHAMGDWNFANASVASEWSQVAANTAKAGARPYPVDVPVLDFLSTESMASQEDWLERHQQELRGVRNQRIEIIEGHHYLHWTQAPALGVEIRAFLTDITSS
ncbi:MAG: alpha/beta hydrolase [Demequinaceae bacterium]|nr:alpha/beta hydrolase [Demequinaceae bacterium]